MKKRATTFILIPIFVMVMGSNLLALTFEFSKDKPGVQTYTLNYLKFTVAGKNIIPVLPTTFYLIDYSPDDIPVLAAQVGKIDKTSVLAPYLKSISGEDHARSISGPHGEKIIYNPGTPPDQKVLSSYVLLDGWLLIGNKKETMINLLKLYKNPSDIVKVEESISSSIKEWKAAGIKVWGDNSNGQLNPFFEVQKKRILIPLIKDPRKIKYIAGAYTLTESKEMSGTLIIKPDGPQAGKDIEGDMRFTGETLRRRLVAIKVPYKGKVKSTDNGIVYETYIGNYMAAAGQIVQTE